MPAAETAGGEASMQVIEPRSETEFRRLDQLGARHPDAVQPAVEVPVPEIQELAEVGEAGARSRFCQT